MKTGFKLAFITLPITAIGIGTLAFIIANSPTPDRTELTERATAVRVVTAEHHTIVPTIVGFGRVTPARTFEAIAEVGGTVDAVNPQLRDGAILPAGAEVLRLSPIDFNLAIAQANANIRSARARLAELDVSEANQQAILAIERDVLAVKTAELARAQTLFAAGTLTQTARDAAQAAHLAQRQKVQNAEGTLALIPTQRAVQTEQIAVYETTLATAERNLARTHITLPFTARVAAHSVEVGQVVKVGQTTALFDGIDTAEIEVQVPMTALRDLMRPHPAPEADTSDAATTTDQTAPLSVDPTHMTGALRDLGLTARVQLRLGRDVVTWPASVDRISDGIDPQTGTVGVVVQVDAAYSQTAVGTRPPLTKGMFVDVILQAAPITGLVVPRSALHGEALYTVDDANRLRITPATPYLVQGDIALFMPTPSGTLPDGSRIVLATPTPVIAGLLLDPHPDTGLMPDLLAQDARP
ncbi:HlyD family secretion protein [Celeribacter sp.]|uniref:HlyD family secretion protein n=1 Tax=Celeribacter sp. TaxID=1890673 RepID=UPI003A95B120